MKTPIVAALTALLALSSVFPSPSAAAPTATVSQKSVAYSYAFDKSNFLVSHIEIELDADGRGRMSYTEKDASEPTVVEIALRPESLARLKQMIEKVGWTTLVSDDATLAKHENLGLTKVKVADGDAQRTATFTYTPDVSLQQAANFFRGLVTQHQRQTLLETARRFQPLDTPKQLRDLESELKGNRIAEPLALLALLRKLSTDERIPLIARNHAKKLADQVEKQ
jgi:hypothetical protein